jgi:Fe-S cluster biogenesis protein NfuA
MSHATENAGVHHRIERIEALTQALEQSADDTARANSQELVHAILELQGAGFERVIELLAGAGESGRALLEAMARDELVGSLLLLYGLHPDDLLVRLERALESVRPALRSHGGEVTLVSVSDGVVRLKMLGSCHGCPSSAITLKTTIEEAITAAAPEVKSIKVDGLDAEPAGFVSVGQLLGTGRQASGNGNATGGGNGCPLSEAGESKLVGSRP